MAVITLALNKATLLPIVALPGEFRMSYADFKTSPLGAALGPILADPAVIARMESLSRAGRPAVEAIGDEVARIAPDADDTTRQNVGRLVRDTMAARGWRPRRKARVRRDSPFSWGAVYAPGVSDPAAELAFGTDTRSGAERLAAVRAILAAHNVKLPTVDEFLAERRAMWDD